MNRSAYCCLKTRTYEKNGGTNDQMLMRSVENQNATKMH